MPVDLFHAENAGSVSLVKKLLTFGISLRICAVESPKSVLVAKELKSWSPVFVPDRFPKLVISVEVMLAA